MANLLIVDASSSLCSVALVTNSEVLHLEEHQPRRHAQRLLPLVDDILSQAGVARQQLDGIAFGRGPGSFTGIRIAIGMVQGMALGLDVPVLGVSSLEMLAASITSTPTSTSISELTVPAHSVADTVRVAAVMNAHMGEVFWGCYDIRQGIAHRIDEEKVGTPESCHTVLAGFDGCVLGNGISLLPELKEQETDDKAEPLAYFVAPRVKLAWEAGEFSGIENHPPVYLRDSVAWKKLDEQPSLLKR